MLKTIRKFFFGDEQPTEYIVVESDQRKPTIFDWVFEGVEVRQRSISVDDQRMIGEPVLTFVKSLKDDHKRYKLEIISFEEYIEYCDAEVYDWMYGVSYGTSNYSGARVTDLKHGHVYYAMLNTDWDCRRNIYRVDNLPFTLNHWEMKFLYLAMFKAKNRTAVRKRLKRIAESRANREREEKDRLDKIERLAYAERFK